MHEVIEVAFGFAAIPKWTNFVTLTNFEIPQILFAEYAFTAGLGD